MGLDNYAARHPEGGLTEEDKQAFRDAGIDLCGGMHSDGVISFRGKWYDPLVAHVTGVSLYQEWIPPETVREMAAALNRYSARRLARIWDKVWPMPWEDSHHSEREVADLQRFFAICAERGLGLKGWW
ncbi:hypothetical protein [Roseiflexus sp. RS-1]|jgi:hypothetical protein|uniref:hypothetical protein n=1 Tax=Roseiflexus sp. (strain RS-1) TaxID=357808 RepID=UPI0000D816A9|nr:hypothetical protein [Roseiflexus sp. RS-1]ABQ91743.1 hypothetical protein RoseRS_3384 [Roseiflexus sp. RS-1]